MFMKLTFTFFHAAGLAAEFLIQQFHLKTAFAVSILVHEWAHMVAAIFANVVLNGKSASVSTILKRSNLTANLTLGQIIQLITPCMPLPAGFNPHVDIPAIGNSAMVARKQVYESIEMAGVAGSLMAAACVSYSDYFGIPVMIGFWITVLLSLVSDTHLFRRFTQDTTSSASTATTKLGFRQELWEAPVWRFFCGNFGIIVACPESQSGLSVFGVLKAMAKICMMRGAQSGGIGALMEHDKKVGCFRSRVSAAKRDDLGLLLAGKFKNDATISKYLKQAPVTTTNMDMGIFFGHTRFATSSIPLATETHPHQWTSADKIRCTFWSISTNGTWTSTPNASPGVMITHNGDFEFFELFGVERTFGQIQKWLSSVLNSPPPASCDSVGIAGVFEYLRTQGLFPQSLRLAYQQKIATSFDESLPGYTGSGKDIEGSGLCAPPTWSELSSAGEVLSKAFSTWISSNANSVLNKSSNGSLASAAETMKQAVEEAGGVTSLVAHLKAALEPMAKQGHPWLARVATNNKWDEFLSGTVENFLSNDLYSSLQTFFKHGRGSFGMAVVCELDPDRIVLAALNQTLSMTFSPENRAVMYSSEPQVIMINTNESSGQEPAQTQSTNNWRAGHPTHRIDLDSGEGEAVLLTFRKPDADWEYEFGWSPFAEESAATPDYCRMFMFNMRHKTIVTKDDMVSSGRIIALKDNSFIDFSAAAKSKIYKDSVAQDLADIPALLSSIHESFVDPKALNRLTVDEFYIQLLGVLDRKAAGMKISTDRQPPIDLLIIGVEVSLWAGEQFATDLKTMFPMLTNVVAISANKVIGVIGNARGTVAPTGFDFTLGQGTLDPNHTMVLAISHSGQTFPTMHATKILQAAIPGRVFVLSGSYDTQMGLAVGHQLQNNGAPFCARMFSTGAGWRGAEPPTVTIAAIHHTLTAILIHCADACNKTKSAYASLSKQEMVELQSVLEIFSTQSVGSILGVDQNGNPMESKVNEDLKKMGNHWSWHILEGVIAWIIAAAYILGTVISGYPLCSGISRAAGFDSTSAGSYVLRTVDACLYIWIWHLSCIVIRLLTGRPLLARFGKRTLVVADVPYVNQTLDTYVSKLFALSFGIASIDVHGANPADHFVHKYTHRVARGVLIAAGRPDGRICSQTTTESSVLLALTQAHVIRSLGCPPEIMTVGHNPFYNATAQDHQIVLPTNRHRFLCEAMIEAEAPDLLEPSQRLAKIASMMEDTEHYLKEQEKGADLSALITTVSEWVDDADPNKSEYYVGVDGLRKPQMLCLAQTGAHRCGDPLCYLRQLGPIAASCVEDGTDEFKDGQYEIETIQDNLEGQSDVEQLVEARCLSLERLLAFEVIFHQMASRVSNFWPLNFDISRSQSGLRICTTAGPVSASDLVREYQETLDFYERSEKFKDHEVALRSLESMVQYKKSLRSGTAILNRATSSEADSSVQFSASRAASLETPIIAE
jgi:hypothetical protein